MLKCTFFKINIQKNLERGTALPEPQWVRTEEVTCPAPTLAAITGLVDLS